MKGFFKDRVFRDHFPYGIIGKFRRLLCPGAQTFNAVNGGILPVNLCQSHRQSLEAVDPPGSGIQVDLIPAVQDRPTPRLKPPLFHHAGAKAADVLDVHGIHGTAVRVHTDRKALFPIKIIQC